MRWSILVFLFVCQFPSASKASSVLAAFFDSTDKERRRLAFEFAASRDWIAFPVRTENRIGLFVLAVAGNKKLMLVSDNSFLLSPVFSPDGRNLVFVRQSVKGHANDLIECSLEPLHCVIRFTTQRTIFSPVQIDGGGIIFSSSDLVRGADGIGRYSAHELWLEDHGLAKKLSGLQYVQLGSICIRPTSILFSALARIDDGRRFKWENGARSEIYEIPFDLQRKFIDPVADPRHRTFPLDGILTQVSSSAAGDTIAFLKSTIVRGGYRYDLVIANLASESVRVVESTGLSFSRPVIVERDAVVNEVLPDGYAIKAVDVDSSQIRQIAGISNRDFSIPTTSLDTLLGDSRGPQRDRE